MARRKKVGVNKVSRGKEQEDDGRVEIKHRHEDEDEDRRDAGDNQLRQVLPIERLQLLNRVHRIDEHVAGAPFLQVARAEGEQVGVEQAAQLDLHQCRGAVAD